MPTQRAHPAHARRGFAFLEAVLGMALLGILAGAILGVLGYAWNVEIQARQTLAAAEVANRVLISYLDDQTSPRKLPPAIDYQQMRFRWSLETDSITVRDSNPDARVSRAGTPAVLEAFDRMEFVTVVAWLDDGTDASAAPGRTPTFTLERMVDPFGFRGVDTLERLLQDSERQSEFVERMMGVNQSGTRSGSGGDSEGSTP